MKLQDRFNLWIEGINNSEEISDEIIAFNFGLIETEIGYSMYLIGSEEYEADDDDWACEVDFEPEDKYFDLKVETDDWEYVQSTSEKLIRNFIASESYQNSFLFKADAITTGFDDGDLTKLK